MEGRGWKPILLEEDDLILFLDFVVYGFVCHYNWGIKISQFNFNQHNSQWVVSQSKYILPTTDKTPYSE